MSKKSSNGSADGGGGERSSSKVEGSRTVHRRDSASASITNDSSDLNDSFLRQLKLMKERVSLLDGDVTTSGSKDADSECSTLRSISNIQTYENVNYPEEEVEENYQLVTPRTLEVPPKKMCLDNQDRMKRSIWTERNLEPLPIEAQLPLEPNVIVVKNSSSDSKSSTSQESLSNITTITCPSCILSSTSSETKGVEILDKYLENVPTICPSNFTVAALFKTKIITNGFKKIFNKSKSKSSNSTAHAEDLSYLSDEQVIRTINYSDYHLPVGQLQELPDVKSSKEIINSLANKVFASTEAVPESSLGISSPTSTLSPHKSFKYLVRKANTYVEENIGDGCENFRCANAIFQRRPQILDLAYYDVDLVRTTEAGGDTQVEIPAVAAPFESESEDELPEPEESGSNCCNMRQVAQFLFPKKTNRYFF